MKNHTIPVSSKLFMLLSILFIFSGTSQAASKTEIDIEVSAYMDPLRLQDI